MRQIMLVEDSDQVRTSLRELLNARFSSIEVVEACNGQVAIDLIQKKQPDLIFLDINLPGLNGIQLTKEIRSQFGKLPIAILTNSDYPEYREAAIKCGASYFLAKHLISCDQIIMLVSNILKTPSIH